MKRTILTIMLPTLLLSSPVLAKPNLFDALFNTIQEHPKATLFLALAGCAAAYKTINDHRKMAYDQGYAQAVLDYNQNPKLFKSFNKAVEKFEKLEEDSSEEEPSLTNAIKAKGKKIKKKSEKAIKRLTN